MEKVVKRYISLFIMIVVLISIGGCRSLIMLRSPEQIRIYLLKITPVSTSLGEVKEIIEKEDYNLKFIFEQHGYKLRDKSGSVIGNKYMRVHIDEYKFIFSVDIVAFYIFDENDKLIEIDVVKYTDGL